MFPRQKLKNLAYHRRARIRTIELRRKENSAGMLLIADSLQLLDWTVSQWRATKLPASLAMLPLQILGKPGLSQCFKPMERIVRGSLVILAIARQLDRAKEPASRS